jgi:hypothetical protein
MCWVVALDKNSFTSLEDTQCDHMSSNNLHQTNGSPQPDQQQVTPQETTGTSTNNPTNTVSHNQSPQHLM